jgi:hypothetical protein
MSTLSLEINEFRVCLDRVRTLLETLIVRGLRACGSDEMAQLKAYAGELERSGAGHVAASLATLHEQIERGDREGVKTLLMAQTSVRLLERLLTLRVVRSQFAAADQFESALAAGGGTGDGNNENEDDADEGGD